MPGSDAPSSTPRLVGTDADLPPERDFDELAELFLGSHDPRADAAMAAPTRVRTIEAVILGHLPVRAALWVHQYARRRAELTGEPVAVVRARAGACGVSIVNGPAQQNEPASLEHALRQAGRLAPTVVLEVSELDEPALAELPGVDAVTVLSGADEAAAVAAYRAAKRFTDAAADLAAASPPVRVAIVGADADRTQAAAERIERASRAFLTGPLEVVRCGSKIGGPAARELFHAPTGASTAQLIAWLRDTPPSDRPDPEPKPRRARASQPHDSTPAGEIGLSDAGLAEPMDDTFETQASRPIASQSVDSRTTRSAAPRAAAASVARATPGTQPLGAAEPASIPGLNVLPGHCPHAPGVRLAGDECGGLHLIAIERRGSAIEPGHAAERLAAAAAWAKLNAELLSRAIGVADATTAAAHLITDDPARARPLLDTDIRVHLAVEVPCSEGKTVTVCRALN
jgi:hypothetical protein